jgi:hypothetical protein
MLQLVGKKTLQFFSALSLGEITARTSDGHRLWQE